MSDRVNRWYDMTGRVAVITGGTGRLARHYAIALSEVGANVVLVDLDQAYVDASAQRQLGVGRALDRRLDRRPEHANIFIRSHINRVAMLWALVQSSHNRVNVTLNTHGNIPLMITDDPTDDNKGIAHPDDFVRCLAQDNFLQM